MTKIKEVEYASMQTLINTNKYQGQQAFFSERLAIMLDLCVIPEEEWMQTGRPYRSRDWRIVRVTSGEARYVMNLQEYTFRRNTVHIIPPGTLVMRLSQSEDNSAEFISMFALSELNSRIPQGHIIYYNSDEDTGKRFDEYFQLILHMAQDPQTPFTALHHAVMALAEDIIARHENYKKEEEDKAKRTTSQQLYDRFIDMLNEHGTVKHEIGFYADKLCVSPNYLSRIIKQVSGQTVTWWINYMIIMEAKQLLLHSSMQIGEIAYKLGFPSFPFFSRFFKQQTGMTAVEFQGQY